MNDQAIYKNTGCVGRALISVNLVARAAVFTYVHFERGQRARAAFLPKMLWIEDWTR